ncbi:hypothetical protein [Leyella lascolaii]|uniref:hypothetical protein n=1 Tax=Leyella lascolaii TaxID=1776379 RepID=UPI00083B20C5|nr:hypothetical protein [Leyella lascolaii]
MKDNIPKALPNRSLLYAKAMQGECNSKTGKLCFTGLDTAEPQLALYKDNANERKESLLFISRVQLALYKGNANERKESLLFISRVQLALCKGNANERKESLLFISRVQLALCKDKKNGLQRQYNHIILSQSRIYKKA